MDPLCQNILDPRMSCFQKRTAFDRRMKKNKSVTIVINTQDSWRAGWKSDATYYEQWICSPCEMGPYRGDHNQ